MQNKEKSSFSLQFYPKERLHFPRSLLMIFGCDTSCFATPHDGHFSLRPISQAYKINLFSCRKHYIYVSPVRATVLTWFFIFFGDFWDLPNFLFSFCAALRIPPEEARRQNIFYPDVLRCSQKKVEEKGSEGKGGGGGRKSQRGCFSVVWRPGISALLLLYFSARAYSMRRQKVGIPLFCRTRFCYT